MNQTIAFLLLVVIAFAFAHHDSAVGKGLGGQLQFVQGDSWTVSAVASSENREVGKNLLK
jgi:hypothetical protein